jgi:D-alanyl-D-alanine carboxypeptidase
MHVMTDYQSRVEQALALLGIPSAAFAARGLPIQVEACELVVAETGTDGREHQLIPAAARAWSLMKRAAAEQGIAIELVSAFRGLERQCGIIRAKQEAGMPLDLILTLSAPPGYSEHHTGRAVDINTPGCEATEEPFEHTEAFAWLCLHGARFGFSMSYPRGNRFGFIYEPWHWYFNDPES